MVTEQGPSIGKHLGADIPSFIVTDHGRYDYARIAVEAPGGGVELSQLADNECIIAPGLLYKRVSS